MAKTPKVGQRKIPLDEWKRFRRVADWHDRTEGHRPPAVSRHAYGPDLLVKLPSTGIPGRTATTIYSATCTVCVEAESSTAGQKTIVETADQVLVYNLCFEHAYGHPYLATGLTGSGTRYVHPCPCCFEDSPSESDPPSDSDSSSDSESSSDSPSDSESSSESESESDSDSLSDSDSPSDSDSLSESGSGSESDSPSESDNGSESDSEEEIWTETPPGSCWCSWTWNGFNWNRTSDTCGFEECCYEDMHFNLCQELGGPSFPGDYNNQVMYRPCNPPCYP
jgi:hypothetical protein